MKTAIMTSYEDQDGRIMFDLLQAQGDWE